MPASHSIVSNESKAGALPRFVAPDDAFAFIDDILARLRLRSPDDDSHLYTRSSASVCASDMKALEAALEYLASCLHEGINRSARRGLRDAFRLRLQELQLQITELQDALTAERNRLAQQSRQVQAAAAWNQTAHMV